MEVGENTMLRLGMATPNITITTAHKGRDQIYHGSCIGLSIEST